MSIVAPLTHIIDDRGCTLLFSLVFIFNNFLRIFANVLFFCMLFLFHIIWIVVAKKELLMVVVILLAMICYFFGR